MTQEHAYEKLVAKPREGIAGADDDRRWKDRIARLLGAKLARDDVAVIGPLVRPDVGASSGNILFTARFDDGGGSAEHNLVLRYQPTDGLMNCYDMDAQFRVQQASRLTSMASAPIDVPSMCQTALGYRSSSLYGCSHRFL